MAVDIALIRDVVIIVPGIMGSELVDRRGQPLWSVAPGHLPAAIRALAANRLALPRELGDEAAPDGVRATRLIDSLHVVPGLWSPVTGYDGLLRFLRSPRFQLIEAEPGNAGVMPNLVTFPYDWRLSNRHNGRLLAQFARTTLDAWRGQPGFGDSKLVLVCHSMGGLVARWFAEQEGGAERIRAMITLGTPHRGALKALTALVNGLEPGIGPLRLPLTDFARSLPSLYQLLPQYDCLVGPGGRSGLRQTACPNLDAAMLRDALAFHDTLAAAPAGAYRLHKVVGIRQPTATTARIQGDIVEPLPTIDGRDQGGDGTVPRLAAQPEAGPAPDVHEVVGQHGELQGIASLHDLLDGILTREQVVWQSTPGQPFGVQMDEVWASTDAPVLRVTGMDDRLLLVTLLDEKGRAVGAEDRAVRPDGELSLGRLREGGYRAIVRAGAGGPPPVAKPFLVLDPGA